MIGDDDHVTQLEDQAAAYAAMTPKDLRREADRRELIERQAQISDRDEARDQLAELIASLPRDLVLRANARQLLMGVLKALAAADEGEDRPTGGEVNVLCVTGMGNGGAAWWDEATDGFYKRKPDTLLGRVARGRTSLWNPNP